MPSGKHFQLWKMKCNNIDGDISLKRRSEEIPVGKNIFNPDGEVWVASNPRLTLPFNFRPLNQARDPPNFSLRENRLKWRGYVFVTDNKHVRLYVGLNISVVVAV